MCSDFSKQNLCSTSLTFVAAVMEHTVFKAMGSYPAGAFASAVLAKSRAPTQPFLYIFALVRLCR